MFVREIIKRKEEKRIHLARFLVWFSRGLVCRQILAAFVDFGGIRKDRLKRRMHY
jgi:hypothetical protein